MGQRRLQMINVLMYRFETIENDYKISSNYSSQAEP
jgi:hypothetical protein